MGAVVKVLFVAAAMATLLLNHWKVHGPSTVTRNVPAWPRRTRTSRGASTNCGVCVFAGKGVELISCMPLIGPRSSAPLAFGSLATEIVRVPCFRRNVVPTDVVAIVGEVVHHETLLVHDCIGGAAELRVIDP